MPGVAVDRPVGGRCWGCDSARVVNASAGDTLALGIRYERTPGGKLFFSLRKYGHMWATIEKFYSCLLGAKRWPSRRPPARVMLPGSVSKVWVGSRFIKASRASKGPVLRELQAVFHGKALHIERMQTEDALPICVGRMSSQATCCPVPDATAARFSPAGVAQLHVAFNYVMNPVERRAMRAFIYSNLGLDDETKKPDTVFFASASSRANARRLIDEAAIVARLRAHVDSRYPELRFVHRLPEDHEHGSFEDEVRLLRRTRVMISLFSSSLHNCRLLPPGSVVVEIHGALGEDWLDSGYAMLCADHMRLRWVGVAAENAVPALTDETTGFTKSPDYLHARANATKLIEVLDAALRADWKAALSSYPLPVFGVVKRADAALAHNITLGRSSALQRGTVRNLLRLPQYRRRPWWLRTPHGGSSPLWDREAQ